MRVVVVVVVVAFTFTSIVPTSSSLQYSSRQTLFSVAGSPPQDRIQVQKGEKKDSRESPTLTKKRRF